MRLGNAIGRYCEIQKASKDKILKSPLVVEAWRGQVLWVDQAWRVFLVILVVTAQVFKKKKKKGAPTYPPFPTIHFLSITLSLWPAIPFLSFVFFLFLTNTQTLPHTLPPMPLHAIISTIIFPTMSPENPQEPLSIFIPFI